MTSITITTQHPSASDQQNLIAYLKHKGAVTTFVDNIHHKTRFTLPETSAHLINEITHLIIEYNGFSTPPTKTQIKNHTHMEFKWCKVSCSDCTKCGLRDAYCSRRNFNQNP